MSYLTQDLELDFRLWACSFFFGFFLSFFTQPNVDFETKNAIDLFFSCFLFFGLLLIGVISIFDIIEHPRNYLFFISGCMLSEFLQILYAK